MLKPNISQLNRVSPRYKWELLLLLWLAFFFNQAE